jgi:SagB-type dehydrogenase family enzyme
VLSRFAYLRSDQGRMILECPLGHAQIHCHASSVLEALHALTEPSAVSDVVRTVAGLHEESATILLNFLGNALALVSVGDDQPNPEVEDAVLAPWEFHDLLFHTRSRLGRHDHPYGGTFRFKNKLPPLPVIKKPMSSESIPLFRPDIEKLEQNDTPFTEVLERRASIREQGDSPISVQQLGEFLYRTARIKRLSEEGGVSFRPYPAGGALHELELYPLVDRCEGLAPGLYHYNPLAHELYKVASQNPYVQTLLRLASFTSTLDKLPQILLIVAARFQRMQHKYQSLTYSVILKNVGALYQTMYLVGTAMGLAPCALGGGHADLFAQAAGLNYLEETSVGEFILGTRTSGSAAAASLDHDLGT